MTINFEEFFKNCIKNLPVSEAFFQELKIKLPENYISFLKFSNGIEGIASNGSYLQFWKAENLNEFNNRMEVKDCIPGMFFIGGDGGEEKIGIDIRQDSLTFGNYFMVPNDSLDWKSAILLGTEISEIKTI